MAGCMVPVFTPPMSEQRRALAVAASYLGRAGTEAATRLLPDTRTLHDENELFAGLRDNLTSAAALCETLTEVFDCWPGCGAIGG